EFEEAFVAELAESAEDGVRVDTENVGEVLGGRESFAALGLAVGDGAAELACDLFVQVEGVVEVELDISHGAKHHSSILGRSCRDCYRTSSRARDGAGSRPGAARRRSGGADRGGAPAGPSPASAQSGGRPARDGRGPVALLVPGQRPGRKRAGP